MPKLVKAARVLLDWSQTDLANLSDTSLGTIQRLEHGATNIKQVTLDAIEETLTSMGIVFLYKDKDGHDGVILKEPKT